MKDEIQWNIVKRGPYAPHILSPTDNMRVLRRAQKVLDSDLHKYLISIVRGSDWKEFFITPGNEDLSEDGVEGKEFMHQSFRIFGNVDEIDAFLRGHPFDWCVKTRIYRPRADPGRALIWLDEIGEVEGVLYGKEPDFDAVYLNGQKMVPAEAVSLFRQGMMTVSENGDVTLAREAANSRW